jgi:hypothetical protein
MRRALLVSASITFALACTDNITEPVPERTTVAPAGAMPVSTPVAFATTTTEDGLSISTDKDDYQPGDVVHFTGSGWLPGDTLDIVLTDDPLTHEPHIWMVIAGGDGTFHDTTYVVDEGDLDVRFTLVATSRETGRSLTVQFTDGRMLVSVQLNGTSSPITVTSGATISATVTVTTFVQAGTGNDNWRGTSWLIGTAIGARACSDHANHDGAGTYTETFAISAPSTPGTYSAFFQAHQGDDCPTGNASTVLTLANFVVVVPPTTTIVSSSENPSILASPVTFTATVNTGTTPVTIGKVSYKSGGTSCADATEVQAPQDFVLGEVKYTPVPNLSLGAHVIRACYGGTSTLGPSEGSVTQQVNAPSNAAPVLAAIGNKSVNELEQLTFTATADDAAGQTLTFSLEPGTAGAVPTGATINSGTGAFTWIPTELQGPGTYTFDVCVADNGTPSLSACETIAITVNEVNVAPVLAGIGNKSTPWGDEVSFTATATDADVPANTLTFSLTGTPPAGASITPAGAFTWTPNSGQIGSHSVTVRVTDDGSPALHSEETIVVTVSKRTTTLVYSGATSGVYGGSIGVAATLTGAPGGVAVPITGKSIAFSLGTLGVTAITQSGGGAGLASAGLVLAQNAGSYTVASAFTEDAEYLGSADSDPFVIDPAPLTIRADNKTMFFGAASPPAFTVTYTGFVLLETPAVLTGSLAFTGTATTANSSTPVGSYVITPGGLTSTNYAISFVNGTLALIYNNVVGHQFLQPVNPNLTTGNRSTFKIGSTIPVKFQIFLADGTTPVSTVVATISYLKIDNSVDASVNEEVVMGGADAGNSFRYDPVAQQYIFNLSTKTWTAGTWQLKATLDDGSTITALVDGRTK